MLKRISAFAMTLCLAFLLASCSTPENPEKDNRTAEKPVEQAGNAVESDSPKEQQSEKAPDHEHKIAAPAAFFPAEGTILRYKGEGNEYAQLKITVLRSDSEYAILQEDNGGVTLHRIYRIGKDRIDLLSSEPAGEWDALPDGDLLDGMEPQQTYFLFPAETGTKIGHYTVEATDATADTPFRTFSGAVMAAEKTSDYTNRIWFVPGYGEVKRESMMTTDKGETFTVSSSLETVEHP
ncbi:hypothetical protein SAMN04488127_1168 [Bhargavaea ginsengi]|uniref:Lipoprotein n=1 Tax=Bhargavaea ginsengi TaxID=426757 RepID=A0A1H6WMH5_9BACL|nr:hypothetical protein [Bhargavaea ginsengi]SEJ16956.1 hypothetical protein SAMN04488127_1168 [Bhargavaea ginsengi]